MPSVVPVCVRIEFGSGTVLRYSNLGLHRADGATVYTWDARVATPSFTWDLGPQDQAFANLATVQISLDNADGGLNAYLPGGASYSGIRWPEARIDVYTGGTDGGNITAMLREFSGSIPIGGVQITPTHVVLSVSDLRERHNATMQGYTLNATDYPNARTDDIGQTVPMIIGDFTGIDTAQAFTALCTNTTTREFKCNTGPIDSATLLVYKDGVLISTASVTEASGLFTVSAPNYDANSVYTCKVYGYPAGDSGCPTSYNPADVIYWLINTKGGCDTADIDSTSFTDAESMGDAFTVRRWFFEETTVFQEVNRLAFEGGYDCFVNRDGKYELKWFAPIISATAPSLTQRNIIDGTFVSELDPDQIYCNRITVNYNDLPNGDYATTSTDDTTEQSTFGRVVGKEYSFYWVYSLSDITTSLQRKLFFWKRMPEIVQVSAVWEANATTDAVYSAFLTDGIRMTLFRYSDATMWVRRCGLDLLSGIIGFRAVNMDSIPTIGVWTDGTLARPGYWGDGPAGTPYDSYWW